MTTTATHKQLYRSYIQHLRLIPDPHLWSVLIPRFRSLLAYPKEPDSRGVKVDRSTVSADDIAGVQETRGKSSGDSAHHAESSAQAAYRELRRARRVKRAHKELRQLRAAVGCHPHAFSRLLEEAYGQRGAVRWELLNHIRITSQNPSATSEPALTGRPPLPPPLLPLRPDPILPQPVQRARKTLPPTAIRRAERRAWTRDTKLVKAPLVLPTSGVRDVDLNSGEWGRGTGAVPVGTGWERRGVVRSLRVLAGLEGRSEGTAVSEGSQPLVPRRSRGDADSTTTARNDEMPTKDDKQSQTSTTSILPPLPTLDHLPTHLRRIFPRNPVSRSSVPPPPPPPPPRNTRQNPRTWTPPRLLTTRLIQRLYHRLWKTLEWVRPAVQVQPSTSAHATGRSRSNQRGREGRVEMEAGLANENEPIRWVKCSWEEMRLWERGEVVRDGRGKKKKKMETAGRPEEGRWSVASEDERMRLSGHGE